MQNDAKKIIGDGSTENKVIRLAEHVSGLTTSAIKHFDVEPRLFKFESGDLGVKDIHFLYSDEKKGPLLAGDLFGEVFPLEDHYPEDPKFKVKALIHTEFYLHVTLNEFEYFKNLMKLQGVRLKIGVDWFGYSEETEGVDVERWGGEGQPLEQVICHVMGKTATYNKLIIKASQVSMIEMPLGFAKGENPVCISLDWALTGFVFNEYMNKIRWVKDGAVMEFDSHGWFDKGQKENFFSISVLNQEVVENIVSHEIIK